MTISVIGNQHPELKLVDARNVSGFNCKKFPMIGSSYPQSQLVVHWIIISDIPNIS